MVKQKQFKDEWKDLRVKAYTAKRLMLYKVNHDLITYDQAINLLLDGVKQ